MRIVRIVAVSWLLTTAMAYAASAQGGGPPSDSALARSIASYLDAEADRFSGVVLVARRGEPIVELACGYANRKMLVANTAATRFQLASGDKWFAKVAISQLVAAGKVKTSDTVGKFLPRYPSATVRSKVTVEQLLTHRSGLGMYWNDAYAARRKSLRTLDDVVALFSHEEPAFTPGERQLYSNNGYVLLGRIVEVASGMSWYEYVRRQITTPAGMTRTAYLTLDEWPADKAIGFTATAGAPQATENTRSIAFRGSSAGGGYSTARDLLRLDAALRRGEIGDTAVLARITARAPGGRVILANGGGAGANVEISRLGDYTIIVLANLDPPAATRVLTQIVALLQPAAPPPANPPFAAGANRPAANLRAEVEQLNASMVEAFQRGDPLAVAAHYTDDARIIGPRGAAVEGREAINAYWKGFPSQGRTWKLEALDVGGTRDLVYQYGRSTISGGIGSQSVAWIGIWRRQANGQLKLAVDYWVPSQ
ncbi:MAG: serine hydrolase [Gemmatimonadaceae bacterium]